MLILTRRAHEQIRIGEHITITVLSLDGHKAAIGIEAPRDVTVDREEIHQRKKLGTPPPSKDSRCDAP